MDNRVVEEYFNWLLDFVCDSFSRMNYSELFANLYNTDFVWSIPLDENDAEHGKYLRYLFSLDRVEGSFGLDILDGPCNMLELLVSLSINIEHVMFDDRYGDRTSVWFWTMIENLGIKMNNNSFDEGHFNEHMRIFMDHRYDSDGGNGGLFYVPGCKIDFKNAPIYHQGCKFEENLVKNERNFDEQN